VHEAGGLIYCQLWHVGRVSHAAYQPGGALPLCSSATPRSAKVMLPDGSMDEAPTPKAMTIDEIRSTIADYRTAASNALRAGFDGVELHGANGYLPDQFLRDGVNTRTDEYGGSIERRARFMLEAAAAIRDVTGIATELSTTGGTSDGRFLAQICSQVVELGPPNASIHKIDEHIRLEDIEPLKDIYRRVLEKLAGLA